MELVLVIVCYLIGSIPFSFLLVRLAGGEDIRTKGSGNVGATNVLRTTGIGVAVLALVGDLLKGLLAAWLGSIIGGPVLAAVCAAVSVIGHCYPVFLGFRGGKGVATSGGIILLLTPKVFWVLLVVFLTVVLLTRYVSLASVTIAVLFPVACIVLGYPVPFIIMAVLMGLLVTFRHRENIERLRSGTEPKLGHRA